MLTRRHMMLASIAAGALMHNRDVLAKAAQPSTPVNFDIPEHACDCHTHIHGDVEKFLAHPKAYRCLRALIEINEQDLAAGIDAYRGVMAILDRAGLRLPRLLHGLDATMWDFYREALAQNLDARIGLEDGKHLPSGTVAEGNAALIRAARALAA